MSDHEEHGDKPEKTEDEKCTDCGLLAPASSVDTSMLSRMGWRVGRRREPTGRDIVELRCPSCWRIHHAKKTEAAQR